MLITCEECGLQMSDKAFACPHCGNPNEKSEKVFTKIPPGKNSRKRLRLPNGFGRITKIKGRTRKPFRAMVTVGKDDNGKPIGKLLKPQSYFNTYNEAYEALVEYNKDPYDVANAPTFSEVYERWYKSYSTSLSDSYARNIRVSYDYCHPIYDVKFRDLRIKHIKLCMEEGYIIYKNKKSTPSQARKKLMKILFNLLFDYALEYEYTDKNYARDYRPKLEAEEQEHHITYTKPEMEFFWAHKDDPIARIILVQCYSGLRPTELLTLDPSNIDWDANIMIGGIKTKAGKDRAIPIHPLIKNIAQVFFAEDERPPYQTFYDRFNKYFRDHNLPSDHRPHDGRKHFITQAKKYNVDEYAIKRIVGHSIKSDITESVYTERDNAWLYSEICKIEKY